jgi:5-methyltetrahydrofolate--homocysteine methyltransferase
MELFENIAVCVTRGKVNQASAYPPDLRGQDGVFELVRDALANGVAPSDILTKGLMVGMNEIGQRFSRNEAFVPDLLMAAKAMTAAWTSSSRPSSRARRSTAAPSWWAR